MAEPRLRIVDELFAETPLPPDATEQQKKRREIDMATVARYVPAITKRARAQREAEILKEAGARTLADLSMLEAIRAEHVKELTSLQLTNDQHAERIEQTTRHRVGSARGMWLAIGILAGATVGVVGTQRVMKDGMFGLVAASRSANDVWSPPESPAVRDVPRCENVADCPALETPN